MTLASLVTIIIVLVILGVALYLIETYVPMSAPIKMIIRVVVILAMVIWLLSQFLPGFGRI